MAEIEVFQRDIADVVVIGNADLIRIALTVILRLPTIPGLHHNLFGEDVLLFKQHFQCALHLGKRELALMQCREDRDQHIGVMLNLIQIKVILVVAVGAFVIVQIVLKLCLHAHILRLGSQHGLVFAEVGGGNHR